MIDHLVNMYEFFIEDIEKIELNYNSKEEVYKKKEEMQKNLDMIKSMLREQKIIK